MQARCANGCRVNLAQDLTAVRQKLRACRRQADAAVGARQQFCANLRFQNLDLLA